MQPNTNQHSSYELSIEEFFDQLGVLITQQRASKRYRFLTATFDSGRYVQVLAEPNGRVLGEVISNLYENDWALTDEDEDELRRLGFKEPVEGPHPNWWCRVEAHESPAPLVNRFVRVVRAVFREQMNDTVNILSGAMTGPVPGQSYEEWLVSLRDIYQKGTTPKRFEEFRAALDTLHLQIDEWR